MEPPIHRGMALNGTLNSSGNGTPNSSGISAQLNRVAHNKKPGGLRRPAFMVGPVGAV
ncbi:hypothetical protein MTYM_01784 [Methylococcales bacterium]|nr:hypothetical protein MTYM_01784 [Methylococcales bacterium]